MALLSTIKLIDNIKVMKSLDNRLLGLIFTSILTILSQSVYSEEIPLKKEKEKSTVVDDAHSRVSETILYLSNSIDSFFGSRRGDDEANGSRLRVFYTSVFEQDQRMDDRIDVRFSLRLPQLQDRLKINFDKSGGGEKTNSENVRPGEPSQNAVKESEQVPPQQNLLPFIHQGKWTFNFNTGLRIDIPPNPFARARLRKTVILWDTFEFNPTQEATWFLEEGFGLNFGHDLDMQLGEDLLFRIVNSAFWLDDDDILRSSHGPILFHQISPRRAISYSALAGGINRPKYFINNYELAIQYRQLIHKKWLFLEIRPAVNFPKERRWQEVYSAFFKIEAVFGSI